MDILTSKINHDSLLQEFKNGRKFDSILEKMCQTSEDVNFDKKIMGFNVQNVRKQFLSSFLCLHACASLCMQTFEHYIGPHDMEGIKAHKANPQEKKNLA